MSEFQSVAQVGDIPAGEGRSFRVAGRLIAIFLIDGEYRAIDDVCPHMGASLSTGHVENGGVLCPWHAWRFCLKKGTWLDSPSSPIRVNTYPVRVEGTAIQISIPQPPAAASPPALT